MQGIGVSAGGIPQHFSLFVANQIGNVFDFPSLIPKVFTILIFSRSKVNFISAKLRKVFLLWNLILLQHQSHSILVQGPKGRGICIQYSTNCFASGLFHHRWPFYLPLNPFVDSPERPSAATALSTISTLPNLKINLHRLVRFSS